MKERQSSGDTRTADSDEQSVSSPAEQIRMHIMHRVLSEALAKLLTEKHPALFPEDEQKQTSDAPSTVACTAPERQISKSQQESRELADRIVDTLLGNPNLSEESDR